VQRRQPIDLAAVVSGTAYRGTFNLPIDLDARLWPILDLFSEGEAHDAC